MIKLTVKQKQVLDAIKQHGEMGVSRIDREIIKTHKALVDKGLLKVVSESKYHIFFDVAQQFDRADVDG